MIILGDLPNMQTKATPKSEEEESESSDESSDDSDEEPQKKKLKVQVCIRLDFKYDVLLFFSEGLLIFVFILDPCSFKCCQVQQDCYQKGQL